MASDAYDVVVRASAGWTAQTGYLNDPQLGVAGGKVHLVESATQVDVHGEWFVIPGFVDHHVHTIFADPDTLLDAGLTRVHDLARTTDEVLDLVLNPKGATVRAYGPMITAPGGYCSRAAWAPAGTAWETADPADAAKFVESLATRGVAGIKVALNADAGPVVSDEVLRAVVATAHARGLPVAAHVQGEGMVDIALDHSMDQLAHTPWTHPLTDQQVERLAATTEVISTLDMHARAGDETSLRIAVDNLQRFHAAGGTVRYGTDIGNGVPHGSNAGEIALLATAGLDVDAILRAVTGDPTDYDAVLALAADPRDDLMALCDWRFAAVRDERRSAGITPPVQPA